MSKPQDGEQQGPGPDSEGVYYLSVDEFEWRPGREEPAGEREPAEAGEDAAGSSEPGATPAPGRSR